MIDLKLKSLVPVTKIAVVVTFFALTAACSQQPIPVDTSNAMIPPLDVMDAAVDSPSSFEDGSIEYGATEYAAPAVQPSTRKKSKRATSSRRARAKQAQVAVHKKQHEAKVEALAQGSLSTEFPLPPPPPETPVELNGPTLELPQPVDASPFSWQLVILSVLAVGLVTTGAVVYAKRLRLRNRRLIFNS